jgi:predicted adenylyl cyclase CyaB
MALEIEKKYRLTTFERDALPERLRVAGAEFAGDECEENTLYTGGGLRENAVLRLRRVDGRAVLTYKERFPTDSGIKRQREDETQVADADALAAILDALGYRPALVYEKRRATWRLGGAEIALDELPFGWFAEIEGAEEEIIAAEKTLGLTDAATEHDTYPHLTQRHGARRGGVIEARFA